MFEPVFVHLLRGPAPTLRLAKGRRVARLRSRVSGTERHGQQLAALLLIEALDCIADGRPRNGRPVRAQVALEPRRIGFAGLAQRPANGLLNEIFLVAMQRLRDVVRDVERDAAARQRDQTHDGRPADPHVPMTRPRPHLAGQLRMFDEQRTDQAPADAVGGRPVRRTVFRQPSLPRRQLARREVALVACDDLDTDRLRLEISIGHQRVGERHRVVDRPGVGVGGVDRSRQRAHGRRADVVEREIARAAEIAARVELADRARQPGQLALHASFRRMKHFK